MTNQPKKKLDDGQPLVEAAPPKPADVGKKLNPMGAVLQGNVGIILHEEMETI